MEAFRYEGNIFFFFLFTLIAHDASIFANTLFFSTSFTPSSFFCFVGFAQNLDGSHDFSRCLSSIPDPTLHIVEIVKQ